MIFLLTSKKDMIWIEQFLLRTIFQLFTTKSIQFTHIFRHSDDSLLFTQWTQKEHLKLYLLKGTDVPIYKCKNAKNTLQRVVVVATTKWVLWRTKKDEEQRTTSNTAENKWQVYWFACTPRLHAQICSFWDYFFYSVTIAVTVKKVILSLYLTVTRQFQILRYKLFLWYIN